MTKVLSIIFILVDCFIFGQSNRFDPGQAPDTLLRLTFKQKIDKATKFDCEYIKLKVVDLDTINYSLSLDVEFLFPDKALTELVGKIISTSSNRTKKTLHIVTAKSRFSDSPKTRLVVSDSSLKVASINSMEINKQIYFAIGLEVGKMCPTFNLYLEFSPNDWYFFKYECGDMKSVSSDKDYNNLLEKSGHKGCYTYGLTAPVQRTKFLHELSRTNNWH